MEPAQVKAITNLGLAHIGDGVYERAENKVAGGIVITANKQNYKAGEDVVITISGYELANVNAFSLALPYDKEEYDFVSVEAISTGNMANYSKNRMHGNGEFAVYPTFINEGNQTTISGSAALVKVTLRAKKKIEFNIEAVDGIIVDKHLNTIKF